VLLGYPDKRIYLSECSGNVGSPDVFATELLQLVSDVIIGAVRHGAGSLTLWNLALDNASGPKRAGGCSTCRGLVTVDGQKIVRNVEYYALAHISKFVRQGAVRVSSNETEGVENVAFVNPDGSHIVIVLNVEDRDRPIRIHWNDRDLSYTVPRESVATVISGPGSTAPTSVWITTGDRNKLLERQPDLEAARPSVGKGGEAHLPANEK
jgi:glucosylceramidase